MTLSANKIASRSVLLLVGLLVATIAASHVVKLKIFQDNCINEK